MSLTLNIIDVAMLASTEAEGRPGVANPWHCPTLDRDVVTDGNGMLAWDGNQFTAQPDPNHKPPDIDQFFAPSKVLGQSTLGGLWDWSNPKPHFCGECGNRVVLACCGELIVHRRPGLFFGRVFDRAVVHRYIAPRGLGLRTDQVELRSNGSDDSPAEPLQVVSKLWTLVVMPMRADMETEGESFPDEVKS